MKRESLPVTRAAITKKFELIERVPEETLPNGTVRESYTRPLSIYFTVGCYPDGRMGELFIKTDRAGSFVSGALEGVAIQISLALQHGIDLHVLIDKLRGMKFAPDGFTGDPDVPSCTSVLDLLAKWLMLKFPAPK